MEGSSVQLRRLWRALAVWISLGLLCGPASVSAVDIADYPVENLINEAPAILMFVLDDSDSMDSEFLTPEPGGRMFTADYVFADDAYVPANDHAFGAGFALEDDLRRAWQARWCGYNRIYYDSRKTYEPWPATARHAFGTADPHRPLSDPTVADAAAVHCRLAAAAYAVTDALGALTVIPHAHYVIAAPSANGSEPHVYLAAWQDGDQDGRLDLGAPGTDRRLFFRLHDDGDGLVEDGELLPVSDAAELAQLRPSLSDAAGRLFQRTDSQELQNFANWFTYHRRREFVLKAVLARQIKQIDHMLVGLYALNNSPRIAAVPVRPAPGAIPGAVDRSEFLLDNLYTLKSGGEAPLRIALDDIGRYVDQSRVSALGDSPFRDETTGGGCQRCAAVVISDGYWNDNFSGPGNVDGSERAPYADRWPDTLADIALYYYRHDLAAGLPDRLTARGCDVAAYQHLTTHTIGFGALGTIDPADIDGDGRIDEPCYEQDPCFADPHTPRPQWPQPIAGQPSANDDIWHAAVNGRGIHARADHPDTLAQALSAIVAACGAGLDHAAPPAVQAMAIDGEILVFQTSYRTDQWTGDLQALTVAAGSDDSGALSGEVRWSAELQLASPGLSSDARRILTYGGIRHPPQGIAFRYEDLSAAQRRLLGSDLVSGSAADDTARRLVDYLRGLDMAPFRRRAGRLGDMVHATPVVAGETVFVGANDGMLHAFDRRTGDERFAYIPHLVFNHLKDLAQPGYRNAHRFYVDAGPSVCDVLVGEDRRRTYLVGGLGKGGRGYFCLRIAERRGSGTTEGTTDAQDLVGVDAIGPSHSENDVAGIVQWEYPRPASDDDLMDNDGDGRIDESGEADPDMGYSFGQGYAVNANTADGAFRPVVIFGNGYNSDRGYAVLVILDAEAGTLIRKIDTGQGADNGLSVPALIDVDLDRRVDYAYAGDLKGNMWKFDLTSESPDQWGVAYGEDLDRNGRIDAADHDRPQPVFQANGQPITGRPDITRTRSLCAADAPGYLVIFGTGRYLGRADRLDTSRQSLYAVWDYGDDGDDSEYLGQIIDRSDGRLSRGLRLVPQQVVEQTDADGRTMRMLSRQAVDFTVGDDPGDGDHLSVNNRRAAEPDPVSDAGWFFDFPQGPDAGADSGERVTSQAVIRGGKALISSFAPDNAPCAGGGISWVYLLDGCAGDNPDSAAADMPLLAPMTAIRYPGLVHLSPAVLKTVSDLTVDRLIIGADQGQILMEPFIGERWGKMYWRQNLD